MAAVSVLTDLSLRRCETQLNHLAFVFRCLPWRLDRYWLTIAIRELRQLPALRRRKRKRNARETRALRYSLNHSARAFPLD